MAATETQVQHLGSPPIQKKCLVLKHWLFSITNTCTVISNLLWRKIDLRMLQIKAVYYIPASCNFQKQKKNIYFYLVLHYFQPRITLTRDIEQL